MKILWHVTVILVARQRISCVCCCSNVNNGKEQETTLLIEGTGRNEILCEKGGGIESHRSYHPSTRNTRIMLLMIIQISGQKINKALSVSDNHNCCVSWAVMHFFATKFLNHSVDSRIWRYPEFFNIRHLIYVLQICSCTQLHIICTMHNLFATKPPN